MVMRGVLLKGTGGIEVLSVAGSLPRPQIVTPFDVLLRVKATAVNRADIMQRKGHYPPPPGASEILGLEAAGTVEAVGESVTKYKVGDRVMALLAGGGYAEYVNVHEGSCLPVPPAFSFEEAAAVPEVFLTAFQALRLHSNLQAGQTALIHAGASGVGTAACQLCKFFKARSIVSCSEGKVEKCRAFADVVVSRTPNAETSKQFADKVIAAVGDGQVNAIIDPVFGGGYLQEDAEVAALDATVVILAFMGGNTIPQFNATPLFRKRIQLKFSTLRSQSTDYKSNLVASFVREGCLAAFETGVLRPVISNTFSLENVGQAHALVESNETIGKVIVTI